MFWSIVVLILGTLADFFSSWKMQGVEKNFVLGQSKKTQAIFMGASLVIVLGISLGALQQHPVSGMILNYIVAGVHCAAAGWNLYQRFKR